MELIAKKRTNLGKKSKKERAEGKIPAVMYAKGMVSVPLSVDYIQFDKVFKEAGESTLVDLVLEGGATGTGKEIKNEAVKVLISEVSQHPVTDKFLHANFHKVNLKEKISAEVPIKIVGESPIVKSGGGILLTLINEVTVEALPSDLPHDIKVDISSLTEVDQGIEIKDLLIDHSKVKITSQEDDELVVKIDYLQKEEEVKEVVSEEELVAKVEATEQLTEEQKAAREKEKKDEDKGEKGKKDTEKVKKE